MSDDELVDLNQHFTCWKGSLTQNAFANLLHGIRREQARLNGKRFLVVLFHEDYDLDGLMESIDLVEGFDNLQEAKTFVEYRADNLLDQQLQRLSYGRSPWHIVDQETINRLARQAVDTVKRVYYRGFKLSDGSGFNSIYWHLEVLEISTGSVIDEDLLKYLNCQMELERYFIEVGERTRD